MRLIFPPNIEYFPVPRLEGVGRFPEGNNILDPQDNLKYLDVISLIHPPVKKVILFMNNSPQAIAYNKRWYAGKKWDFLQAQGNRVYEIGPAWIGKTALLTWSYTDLARTALEIPSLNSEHGYIMYKSEEWLKFDGW